MLQQSNCIPKNTNSAHTVLYFFLLLLHKVSPCKIVLLCDVAVLHFVFIKYKLEFFFSLIKLQVEQTLDKCYDEPRYFFFFFFSNCKSNTPLKSVIMNLKTCLIIVNRCSRQALDLNYKFYS